MGKRMRLVEFYRKRKKNLEKKKREQPQCMKAVDGREKGIDLKIF